MRAMNARPLLLVATLLCSLASASCSYTFRAHAAKGALAKRQPAAILVHTDDSGDKEILLAVEHGLHARGFPVQHGSRAALLVKVSDTWRWDWTMYLKELEITFIDSKTGTQKAHALYRNSPWHRYPSRTWVVQKLFHELDQQGVFQK
jgi:hypothetical protein